MSGPDHGLIVRIDGGQYRIEGLVSKREGLPKIYIEFIGQNWAVKEICDEQTNPVQTLFEYYNGVYRIPSLDGDKKNDWAKDLPKLMDRFPVLEESPDFLPRLETIVTELQQQKHGTSIVFMDSATLEEEKKRFIEYNRQYPVKEFSILEHKEKILGISAVDGALFTSIFQPL